jgi:hypothetical protein
MEGSAAVAVALLGVVGVFQLALAFGAPLGRAAFGGQHDGVLPTRLRVISGAAGAVIYPFAIALVAASAGWIDDEWMPGDGRAAMWVLVGIFLLGALMNGASPSKLERFWAPVSLVIAVCCGIIAVAI